jgi:DNA-binding NtrC family response regulator
MKAQPFVMIVEDDFLLADVYVKALRKAGLQAEVVESVAEAQTYLARVQPDVILLDIGLPDGHGGQVLDYMHSHTSLMQTRIVVTTGMPHFSLPNSGHIHSILRKPISSARLRGLVMQLCHVEPSSIEMN